MVYFEKVSCPNLSEESLKFLENFAKLVCLEYDFSVSYIFLLAQYYTLAKIILNNFHFSHPPNTPNQTTTIKYSIFMQTPSIDENKT